MEGNLHEDEGQEEPEKAVQLEDCREDVRGADSDEGAGELVDDGNYLLVSRFSILDRLGDTWHAF